MNRSNLIDIFVHLTTTYQVYKTEYSNFLFEFDGKEYEIKFRRHNGQFESFSVNLLEEEKNAE